MKRDSHGCVGVTEFTEKLPILLCFLHLPFFLQQHTDTIIMMMRTTAPPTLTPTISPTLFEDEESNSEAGAALLAPTRDEGYKNV